MRPRAGRAARSAWDFLRGRQRTDGRWGFNERTIGDGDSTAWALRLAFAHEEGDSPAARQASEVLAEHYRPDGGVSTYATDGPIRRLIEAPPGLSFRGWCGAHTCVTAAASSLPGPHGERARVFLRDRQRPDGSWDAYWWCDAEYSTALAIEALAAGGDPGDRARIRRAVLWAAGRPAPGCGFVPTGDHPGGSPFATALCLRTLLRGEDMEEARAAARDTALWLWLRQREDGSWRPSARLRVPWPDDDRPDTFTGWIYGGPKEGALIVDHAAVFTTATVLSALGEAKRAGWV